MSGVGGFEGGDLEHPLLEVVVDPEHGPAAAGQVRLVGPLADSCKEEQIIQLVLRSCSLMRALLISVFTGHNKREKWVASGGHLWNPGQNLIASCLVMTSGIVYGRADATGRTVIWLSPAVCRLA